MCCVCVFFFKQKTAYEMRNSDWSSDVCSSDLIGGNDVRFPIAQSLSGGTQRLSLLGIARPGQKRGGATRALAHVGNQHFGCLSQVIHERPSSISPRTTKAAAAAPAQAPFNATLPRAYCKERNTVGKGKT